MSNPEKVVGQINTKIKSRKDGPDHDVLFLGNDPRFKMEKVTSGSYAIDYVLRGGFPRRRSIEIFGDWQTGKTYLALRTVAEAQKRGEVCAYIDTERCLDVDWAEELGVDLDELIMADTQGLCGEEVLDVIEGCLRIAKPSITVLDSISGLIPRQEMEKSATEITVGQMGKMMSMGMRKLTAANPNAVLMFLNQTREKIGINFGDPTTTQGGRALGFFASQRLRLKLGKKVRDETTKRVLGQEVKALVEKDKTGSPYSQISFTFDFKHGYVDRGEELFAIGMEEGLITKEARRYQFGGDSYARKALIKYLKIRAVEEELISDLGLTLLD